MADVIPPPVHSPMRKRNHEGDIIDHGPVAGNAVSVEGTSSIETTSRQASPAPSTTISELTELTSSIASPAPKSSISGVVGVAEENSTPMKKRKLTFAEREVEKAVKKREKEEKEKAKTEEKARKEEEKRLKDEEKRQREEEKEAAKRDKDLEKAEKKKIEDAKRAERDEKKKAKDVEKQEKEAEKAKKEADKLKKERAQLRIGAFFGKPALTSTPPSIPDDVSTGACSRRSSVTSIDVNESLFSTKPSVPKNLEFEKYIIPYFVHEHTEVAPYNRFPVSTTMGSGDEQSSNHLLGSHDMEIPPVQSHFPPSRRQVAPCKPVKLIMDNVHGAAGDVNAVAQCVKQLRSIPYKILSFREDIRPPYMGTISTHISHEAMRRMSRNPTFKGRPDTNYDYDSEAEWEPPGEDDDEINLEDEMSESEGSEDEMADFLDDEEDAGRRRLFVSEMEPVSSGLCWEGQSSANHAFNLEEYRMDVLHNSTTFPIDPYSTAHWTDSVKPKAVVVKPDVKGTVDTKIKVESNDIAMPPPPTRLPLVSVNAPNSILSYATSHNGNPTTQNENASPITKHRGRPPNPNKELKMIQEEYLPAFKDAIDGSDLTKTGLIEILKKQFPKCSKDAIKDTLGVVAVRVGKKEAEKKWALVA